MRCAAVACAALAALPLTVHAATPYPPTRAPEATAVASPAPAPAPAAFWQGLAGTWVAEASYLDEQMQPIVARYAALAQVELTADGVLFTEWKFYPDSELARGMSGGKLPAGRGLETVTLSRGRADPAQPGAVQFGSDRGRWVAATPELATALVAGKADAPRYRYVAALSGPDHAEISTWGYHDDGSFKGVALFRMRRIAAADLAAQLAALRGQYAIGFTMDSRPR